MILNKVFKRKNKCFTKLRKYHKNINVVIGKPGTEKSFELNRLVGQLRKYHKNINIVIGGPGTGKSFELNRPTEGNLIKCFNGLNYMNITNGKDTHIIDINKFPVQSNKIDVDYNVKREIEDSKIKKYIIIDNADRCLKHEHNLYKHHNMFLDWFMHEIDEKKEITLVLNSSTFYSKNRTLESLVKNCKQRVLLNIPIYEPHDYMKILNCGYQHGYKLFEYTYSDIGFIIRNYEAILKNTFDDEGFFHIHTNVFKESTIEQWQGYINFLQNKTVSENIYNFLEEKELVYKVTHQMSDYDNDGYLPRYIFHKKYVDKMRW